MPVAHPPALDLILPMLRCPVCGARLLHATAALRCPARHSFDIARHGYVSLLTGVRATSGDDAPMVRARRRFLQAGSYAPIRAVIAELAARAAPPPTTVVEVGCGTGYYLALPRGRDRRPGADLRSQPFAPGGSPSFCVGT
jgi:23S rRNA (guanine745-N1)-methyltransferase